MISLAAATKKKIDRRAAFSLEDINGDPQARRYRDVIDARPKEVAALVEFLADPDTQGRMLEAALLYERTPPLAPLRQLLPERLRTYLVVTPAAKSLRMHQLIGVAVRILMAKLGFVTTGRKGIVGPPFKRAELYVERP